jgi:hypothetical protein
VHFPFPRRAKNKEDRWPLKVKRKKQDARRIASPGFGIALLEVDGGFVSLPLPRPFGFASCCLFLDYQLLLKY